MDHEAGSETLETRSAEETEALGARIVGALRPGDVVALTGEVGAGKTTLVRGAARALGVTRPVTSPTFTIGRRYEDARVPLAHLDLHRLGSLDDEEPELLADYLDADHIAFVEWPGAAGAGLAPKVAVDLQHGGQDLRRITVQWRS